jgi:hypothetical protein
MPKSKSRTRKTPKWVLALPDLEHAKTAVPNSLTSASGQRTYDHAIREFVGWYCSEPRLAFNRTVVPIPDSPRATGVCSGDDQPPVGRRPAHRVRGSRRRAPESRTCGWYPSGEGVRRIGVRLGNWLTPEQGRRLLESATPSRRRRAHTRDLARRHAVYGPI